jgi:hypothetical protein
MRRQSLTLTALKGMRINGPAIVSAAFRGSPKKSQLTSGTQAADAAIGDGISTYEVEAGERGLRPMVELDSHVDTDPVDLVNVILLPRMGTMPGRLVGPDWHSSSK